MIFIKPKYNDINKVPAGVIVRYRILFGMSVELRRLKVKTAKNRKLNLEILCRIIASSGFEGDIFIYFDPKKYTLLSAFTYKYKYA
jgi:hypothetical protein